MSEPLATLAEITAQIERILAAEAPVEVVEEDPVPPYYGSLDPLEVWQRLAAANQNPQDAAFYQEGIDRWSKLRR